ncbi:MAG: hypothetical protein K9H64_05290 [Bacteroidales bacterium]|nr:hypothetical protein [Bacteroidales bacterium]MCF8455253.1 hypothetical protein [Bacteroidales bacterium]
MLEPDLLKDHLRKLDQGIVLQSEFRRADLIHQTAQQIQKDFAEFGMEVTFSGKLETAYDELLDQMHTHLKHMIAHEYHKLFNFFYRIDLNEKTIVRTELEFPEYSKAEVLCHLIIQREIKKVLIRNYFKEKGI